MIKNLFTESLATIYAAKYCILTALIIYVCASATGWLYPKNFPFMMEQARELVEGFIDKNAFTFISKIFVRNLIATYITTCIISLWGLFPASAAISNGLLLGWVIAYASGASSSIIAIMLIPHGVFEWPAMIVGYLGNSEGVGTLQKSLSDKVREVIDK